MFAPALEWGIAAAIATAALSCTGAAQTVRLGVVMDAPRERLEREWTDEPRQVERAYCVTGWWAVSRHASSSAPTQDASVFRVVRIGPAHDRGDDIQRAVRLEFSAS